ncbi:MAG TPA: hypothetical protein VNQ90_07595 [Chthoniobacteraceae bacterium]|nr:hypothetical protein [Chthoniobacteraceae bacterium]
MHPPIPRLSALLLFLLMLLPARGAETLSLRMRDGLTLYYAADGATPLRLKARWTTHSHGEPFDPVVARIEAPDGEVVGRLESDLVETGGKELPWEVEIPAARPGIYRLTWTAFQGTLEVEVNLPVAFSGHPVGLILPEGRSRFYFVVPPGMKELVFVPDEEANLEEILNAEGQPVPLAEGGTAVPVAGHVGEIWSVSVSAKGKRATLGFAGAAPVPLAASPEAAKAVGGAVQQLDGGILCFFPWQEAAWRLLEEYRQLPAADYEVPLPDLAQFAKEWEAEPARNLQLFGPGGDYANLKPVTAAQNLDPKSPWFGAIHVWRHFGTGLERSAHPAQFYRREEAFGDDFRSGATHFERRVRSSLGIQQGSRQATMLAAVYVMDEPFNPLYRHPALLRRIVIALLQDVMMIRPSELLEPSVLGYYGGARAFHFNWSTRAYSIIGPWLPEREKHVIDQAMHALADRHLVGRVGLVTNQWLNLPAGIAQVWKGSGDEHYRDWTRKHLRWILNGSPTGDGVQTDIEAGGGLQPAGYHTEAGGPDATYNGITLKELAELARDLNDPDLVRSVQRSYAFFNHTIVPHPTDPHQPGYGAFDFSHRTQGSWWKPQWGAGFVFMADRLPEAGLRAGFGYFISPEAPDALKQFRSRFRYNPANAFDLPTSTLARSLGKYSVWKYFPATIQKGRLPAEEKEAFFRNFGDEFFCVRRGDYYAMVYAGSTMPEWMRKRVKDDIRQQYPQNGGGLGLLWSREAGPTLIGRNLGSYAAHSLIATHKGKPFKNDYWATQVREVSPEDWTVTVEGKMLGVPLSYTRTYRFGPKEIAIELEISASREITLDALEETLPLTQEKEFAIQARTDAMQEIEAAPVSDVAALRLKASEKTGIHHLRLDPPRTVRRAGAEGFALHATRPTLLRPLSLALPTVWKAGERKRFSITFSFASSAGD